MEIGEKIGKPTGCQYLLAVESLINESELFPWKEKEEVPLAQQDGWDPSQGYVPLTPQYEQMSLLGELKGWYEDPKT